MRMFDFSWLDVEFWLGGFWILVGRMLNFCWVDIGFWLGGR